MGGGVIARVLDPLGILGSPGLFGQNKTADIPAPAVVPSSIPKPSTAEADAQARAAAEGYAALEKKRKGRAATIMTGPEGLETVAPTAKKQLMGE